MNFTRLIVNGCSFTYGQELEDPQNQCWGKLTADKLGIPFTNLAVSGAGNDRIYRTTTDHLYQSNDERPLYIIAFSYSARREEYFEDIKDYRQVSIGYECATEIERFVLENYNSEIYAHRKLLHWVSTVNALKVNNISYLVTDYMPEIPSDDDVVKIQHTKMYEAVHNDPNRLENFLNLTERFPRMPQGHDGFEAQQFLANYIYEEIIKRWP